jgi:Aspartyl protease
MINGNLPFPPLVLLSMRSLLCLCALFLCATASSVAQTSALPPFIHAKLIWCDGMPCIDAQTSVQTGSKHLRLAVDTGNPTSVLNLKSAEALGVSLEPIMGSDGKPVPHFQKAVLNNVIVGDIVFKELKFLAVDLTPSIADKTFPDIDGTLAYGALKDRILQLDYPAGVLALTEPLTSQIACPGTCGDISLITFGHRGPPIVTTTGFTVNGKPIAVQVDTMFTGTLVIFPTSVEKLGLTTEAASKDANYFAFTDGGVDMYRAQASQLGFGSRVLATKAALYFAGPKVHLPDGLFDGTVGEDLLKTHRVSFNFHDNKFWLD